MAVEKSGEVIESTDTNNISYLVYPNYLRTEAYQYRHLKIDVNTSTAGLEDVKKVAEAYYDTGVELVQAAGEAITGTTDNVGGGADGIKASIEKANKLRTELAKGTETVQTFILPLPNEFTESMSHEWNTEKGLAGMAYEGVKSNALGGLAIKAMNMGAESMGKRQPVGDPGYWQSYTGTQPREFTFTFDLIPSNIDEAYTIMDIVKLFKVYTMPSTTASGAMLLAPHFFKISLANPYIDKMIDLSEVVCTSMSVNYGADGQMQQTQDGMPKYIQMSLSFRDKRVHYAPNT